MKDNDNIDECSNFYSFKNTFIHLEKNVIPDVIDVFPIDFKKCSKFAHRFTNSFSDTVFVNESKFIVLNDHQNKDYKLCIYKNEKLYRTLSLPVETPLPDVHSYSFNLFSYKDQAILLMEDLYTTQYLICKYNSEGDELLRKEIEHTYIDHPEPNTNHHNRYLYFNCLTTSQMVFSSHLGFSKKNKTIIFSMDDFSMFEFDKTANGVIFDNKEENVIGFINAKKDQVTLQMINNKKYQLRIKDIEPSCEMILKDNLLFIANYHPIATGSNLYCFDLLSGKMKWRADVLQVNAEHSRYHNKVTLSVYKNKLIMEGNESYGKYVQLFDIESGKRLAHFGDIRP